MTIDPRSFDRVNVTDTCAIWNVLSSDLLYRRAMQAGCDFCCTEYVAYEALVRAPAKQDSAHAELQSRLRSAREAGQFKTYSISLLDLIAVATLQARRRLSLGELSSIAFASNIRQAFLTDDQKARRLAGEVPSVSRVQTTPHMFAWLYFTGQVTDADVGAVIEQHEQVRRPLRPHFEAAYAAACRARLMERSFPAEPNA